MTATVARPPGSRRAARRFTPTDVLLAAYVATLPIEQLAQLPGVGGSLSRPVGLAAIGMGLIGFVFHPRLRRPNQGHVALSLFVVWAALSAFWSTSPSASVSRLITYLPLLLVTLLIHDRLMRPGRLQLLLGSLVAGATVGLLEVLSTTGGQLGGDLERVGSANLDVNEFGITMSVAVASALLMTRLGETRFARRACAVFAIAAPPVILLTGSKGALLALMPSVVLVLVWAARRNVRAFARVVAGIVAAVSIGLMVIPQDTLDRLNWLASPDQEDASVETRSELVSAGAEIFVDQPLVGIGSAAFGDELEELEGRNKVAHSTSISVAAELGLIGLALAGYAVWFGARAARRLRNHLSLGFMCFGLAWLIGANTLTWEHAKVTWFVLALLVSAPTTLRQVELFQRRSLG